MFVPPVGAPATVFRYACAGGTRIVPEPDIPGCELIRRIGHGSRGDVWLAWDGTGVYRQTFEHDRTYERQLSGIRKFEPVSRSHACRVNILQTGENREHACFR